MSGHDDDTEAFWDDVAHVGDYVEGRMLTAHRFRTLEPIGPRSRQRQWVRFLCGRGGDMYLGRDKPNWLGDGNGPAPRFGTYRLAGETEMRPSYYYPCRSCERSWRRLLVKKPVAKPGDT